MSIGVVPESSPSTGELLDGRYLLHSRVGVGGMGVVYRARDETLGRTVAVKVFRESAADAARTTSETRLLAGLNHPALVTLFDAQITPDAPNYLVMEFVEGPTLRERITEGPLGSSDVATMAHDLAEALHVVHGEGIVHRDIKPSNILLRRSHLPGQEFRAKLADFGIAYLIDSTRLTTPGTLIGTAAYLSPEQVRGADPVPASDIYALGLVLVEALTGERAFPQTGTHEAALARLSRDPEIPGSVGYGWKSLLTAMTLREPEQRPTALEVMIAAQDLVVLDPAEAIDVATTGAIDTVAPAAVPTAFTPPAVPTTVAPPAVPTTVAPPAVPATVATDVLDSTATKVLYKHSEPVADHTPSRLRRWHLLVAVAALLLIAAVVGIVIWVIGAADPAAAPTLPALEEPVGGHLQQLLDSVTP